MKIQMKYISGAGIGAMWSGICYWWALGYPQYYPASVLVWVGGMTLLLGAIFCD